MRLFTFFSPLPRSASLCSAAVCALALSACGGGDFVPAGVSANKPGASTPAQQKPAAPTLPAASTPSVAPTPAAYQPYGAYPTSDCVQESASGLLWEVKKTSSPDASNLEQRYTHYDDASKKQKASGKRFVAPTQQEIDARQNATGYVKAVNAAGLCGHKDWRLPTVQELERLVDTSKTEGANIHDALGPTEASWYWASNAHAAAGDRYVATGWSVDFKTGAVTASGRGSTYRVRLIRGEALKPAFSAEGAVVKDASTGLVWKRCAEGHNWNGTGCEKDNTATQSFTCEEAIAHITTQTGGWRAPTRRELLSLVDYSKNAPAIDSTNFPDAPAQTFWTATPVAGNASKVWTLGFNHGTMSSSPECTQKLYLRLVRNAS